MKTEEQDKLWNDLSEEKKEKYRKDYKEAMEDCGESALIERRELLAEIFGSHNLNPKTQIKTWEDMIDNDKFEEIDSTYVELEDFLINKDMDNKLRNKILATYQIQQLIDLFYGGMVSEEEWKKSASYDKKDALWTIVCEYKKKYQEPQFRIACNWEQGDFLSFHSKELAEEFMSHESNRRLVRQYFMM